MEFKSTEDTRIERYSHPTKFNINYDKIKIGDIWCTCGNKPHQIIIKGGTWGWSKAFSLKHCNHVAIVVKILNQFFLVEAISHVSISSCYKYLNPNWKNMQEQVCYIARFVNATDHQLENLNEQLLKVAADYVDYDLKGCLGTKLPLFSENENNFFCSELGIWGFRRFNDNKLNIRPNLPKHKIIPMHFQIDLPNQIEDILKVKGG